MPTRRRRSVWSLLVLTVAGCGASGQSSTTPTSSATGSVPGALHATAECRDGTLTGVAAHLAQSRAHPEVTEFLLPSGGRPTAVVAAPNGQAWVTEEDAGKLARIDRSGAITEWTLPDPASQPGSYSSPDGQGGLWFPERGHGAISHLDASGAYRSCVLPFRAEPIGVALSPDGWVWFADFSGTVGRVDSHGRLVYWSMAGHLLQPGSVLIASDGSAWATDYRTNTLLVVGRDDRPAFLHLPAPGGALAMWQANDGTIWIAQSGADRIGRVSPARVITDIKLTSAGAHQPQAITQASDGSFWFTESRGNRLGHLTADGMTVTETGEIGRWPDGIARSGALVWFSEYNGDAIGFVEGR